MAEDYLVLPGLFPSEPVSSFTSVFSLLFTESPLAIRKRSIRFLVGGFNGHRPSKWPSLTATDRLIGQSRWPPSEWRADYNRISFESVARDFFSTKETSCTCSFEIVRRNGRENGSLEMDEPFSPRVGNEAMNQAKTAERKFPWWITWGKIIPKEILRRYEASKK